MRDGLTFAGARLVVTRRPITPREPRPGRHLYGRVAPEGRPPSAFSLRYLQFESRALPSLEPIPQITQSFDDAPTTPTKSPIVQRSESTGSLYSCMENGEDTNNNQKRGKLPALLQPPKIAASLDNCKKSIGNCLAALPSFPILPWSKK